ncbi:MAG: hypothetical protein IJQ43_08560 [Oscillospiraceae bacterium]|nr:hypothetical protein [Oscillospiraceae bacterium]
MNRIRVDSNALNAQASELERLENELARLSDTLGSISSSLAWKIPGSTVIRGTIAAKRLQLAMQRNKAAALASGLRNVAFRYKTTEMKLSGKIIGEAMPPTGGDGGVGAIIGGAVAFFTGGEISYGEWKNKKAFNKGLGLPEQKKIDGPQRNKDEKWYKKSGTIIQSEKDFFSGEATWKEYSAEGKSKYAQGSADVKFATAEYHGKGSAGLYVYEKDANGNTKRIFSPGVEAEVGASAALMTASAEGRIGLGENNNMLGVYGNGEVEVASAEAKAKLAINRNEVHGELSAEANLVKAEGSAGVSVLGTDIGVNGAVKVGVGAHAEIGYTDGKFKVDVGAAIGVGVDLGFEVDVSGTVDAVKSLSKSIFHW